MESIIKILEDNPLFRGVSVNEMGENLRCLGAKRESFDKGGFILSVGDTPDCVGLLLSGSCLVIQEDFWGNRNIIAKITPPEMFAEAFACSPGAVMGVSVTAEEKCEILWLSVQKILTVCPSSCPSHHRIIQNLISTLAAKNLRMNEKLGHIGQRTTTDKVLSFLAAEARKHGSREFDIAFNREQLADYLSVERSALSAKLSQLRQSGVLDFRKNHFVLKSGSPE